MSASQIFHPRGARLDADERGRASSLFYCVRTRGLKQTASVLSETETSPGFCLVEKRKRRRAEPCAETTFTPQQDICFFFACETSEAFNTRPSHNGEQKERLNVFARLRLAILAPFFCHSNSATGGRRLRQIVLVRPRTHL